MPEKRRIHIALILLLCISALIRAFIAGSIELGNDEVYYWTYARFPDLSHFDHPPMVGLVIQFFTLNLTFEHEFFLRLASVVLGTFSTWLMFQIGRSVKDDLTGLYAAILFTASFYGFVISGTFIMPDSPQVPCWLLTIWLFVKSLPFHEMTKQQRNMLFFSGLAMGFGFLSKYHTVFLPAGAFLYLLIFNRSWFKAKELYMTLFFFALLTLPVVFWNMENQFISFTFHENRVGITESGIQLPYLATELAGQFFYNNPVNVILILVAFIALVRGNKFIEQRYLRLLLLTSLPLIAVFTGFSLFRPTLPHWSGPGYLGLLVIPAAWLAQLTKAGVGRKLIPWPLLASIGLLLLVAGIAVAQIRSGVIPVEKSGGTDVTHDLTGWKQLGEKFNESANRYSDAGLISREAPIITFRWFPAAHFDYYVARPMNRNVYALGTLERIHKYYWINRIRGPLKAGSDAWYIGLSDDFQDPVVLYGELFTLIVPTDTLVITRDNEIVRYAYLYRMLDLKADMQFTIENK
jgi:4-amino-4-deoxy-L-arabinose transferase-like glycosyltransferase